MADKYIQNCAESINRLIKVIHKGGKRVQALGIYLTLDDVSEVRLTDREGEQEG